MPRYTNQKLKLLYILRFLEEETDATHGVTMEQIISYLQKQDVKAERKSVYDDIECLCDLFGMNIEKDNRRPPHYSLVERKFELPELKMMVDAIASSKFLSEKKTRELIKKVESLCSHYDRESLNREIKLANRIKSMNQSIHYNLDTIANAINQNHRIKFKYFHYDTDKKRRYSHGDGTYIVSPWKLFYVNDNYYLLAWDGKKGSFRHFRVDKMESVQMTYEGSRTSDPREGEEEFKRLDLSHYTKSTFNMFSGEITNVSMQFTNNLVDAVLDRFGQDITLFKVDEDHFKIMVPIAVSQQFLAWIFSFGTQAQILSPESVKKQMKSALAENANLYN